jgi:hypothetical protein
MSYDIETHEGWALRHDVLRHSARIPRDGVHPCGCDFLFVLPRPPTRQHQAFANRAGQFLFTGYGIIPAFSLSIRLLARRALTQGLVSQARGEPVEARATAGIPLVRDRTLSTLLSNW